MSDTASASPAQLPFAERIARGKSLRDKVTRAAQGIWKPPADRPDPIATLQESSAGRVPELIPIRYGRMLRSAYTFLRGAAAVMARDLASGPRTGLGVQACGDAHLSNFGMFATPERNLVFDLNDFDETLPGPWEWDLKRLVTSVVVASRHNGHRANEAREAALACARSYRQQMRDFAEMSPLEVWYYRLDAKNLLDLAPDAESRAKLQQLADNTKRRLTDHRVPKFTGSTPGQRRLVETPPLVEHIQDEATAHQIAATIDQYAQSLPDDRRPLLERYRCEDVARKVMGVGSVGTRCYVGLFFSDDDQPLLLQFKEARRSVLEPFTHPGAFAHQGQRVVVGQRLMQSASDLFLGWSRSAGGYDFYARQLRDMKFSVTVDDLPAARLQKYAEVCAAALARAHAKTGDAATISGYLGRSDQFDTALGDFAAAYADQTEHDHAALAAAVQAGRLPAIQESDPE